MKHRWSLVKQTERLKTQIQNTSLRRLLKRASLDCVIQLQTKRIAFLRGDVTVHDVTAHEVATHVVLRCSSSNRFAITFKSTNAILQFQKLWRIWNFR